MKKITSITAFLFFVISMFSQNLSKPLPVVSDTMVPKKDTVFVPVVLTPIGTKIDTVASIEFLYVGYNNQMFYDEGYVLREFNLLQDPSGQVYPQQTGERLVNSRNKRFYINKADVPKNIPLSTCACYVPYFKQPVPIPKQEQPNRK